MGRKLLKLPEGCKMFTNAQLRGMICPLVMEQLLVMLVGVADTFVVSFAGEFAVSGVSLVNSFNTVFIFLFTALASGGAVIVSQYLGRQDSRCACESVSQLLMISALFSLFMAAFVLLAGERLLYTLFGQVEPQVMQACRTYLRISAYSYPALAVYNAGAALYRSIGRTRTTMIISIFSNVINVAGNFIGVFVLDAGVAGVAYPSLLARLFSAAAITLLCFQRRLPVWYDWKYILSWNQSMLKRMLRIAVPNGIESGLFQLVKVALSSLVALFGTYQIAANGIAQSIWSLAALVSTSMGPVFITVIGQCMGAKDSAQARAYFHHLMKITLWVSVFWNAFIFVLTPILAQMYAVSNETRHLVIWLVLLHNVFNAVAFPFADPLGKGLRAAGDVRFTTLISLGTTIGVRLTSSYLLAMVCKMGIYGIVCAMCLDWTVRGIVFYIRLRHGVWEKYNVIE